MIVYVVEMDRDGEKSYVKFSYDIIWCSNVKNADFYNTPEEAEKEIPDLLAREKDCEKSKMIMAARGLLKLPEGYKEPQISMRVREVELNLL